MPLKLCRALGYDINTVEFAVENGIPYAIDFMNPVPDADLLSVGERNFEWMVRQIAGLAIAKAKSAPQIAELRWPAFLGARRAREEAPGGKRRRWAARTRSIAQDDCEDGARPAAGGENKSIAL